MSRNISAIRKQAGVTLVELMVAMVLSLLLLYGVVTIFQANKQGFLVQDSLARLQENGRFAVQMIARDIRRAGYWGCDAQETHLVNTLNNASSYAWKFDNAVDGFEATSASAWSPALDSSIKSASGGSDVLTVRFADIVGARVTQHNTPSADLKVTAKADLAVGDIAMVTDCRDSVIFQITNVQTVSGANTNVVHNTGTGNPGNATKDLGKKFFGSEMVRVVTRSYYVRPGASGEPALWRVDNGGTPVELLEGVEAMSVQYGVDTDGDSVPDAYRAADAVTDWSDVYTVHVDLLLRSERDSVAPAAKAYSFNEYGNVKPVSGSDRRMRQVMGITVGIRNKLR